MTWAAWRTGLTELFADLGGVPFDWASQPRQMHISARGQLDMIGLAEIGVPDVRHREDDVDPNIRIEERIGQRRMTLQASVWSPKQALEDSARVVIERIRSRLYFASTASRLRAMFLALIRCEAPLQLDALEDDRLVSRWSMDVACGFAWSETDTDNPGTWIDSVEVTPDKLRDPGGTAYAETFQTPQLISIPEESP